jgi:hydroxymethylpyrimidine/phosphomethylpyrimidine kinase
MQATPSATLFLVIRNTRVLFILFMSPMRPHFAGWQDGAMTSTAVDNAAVAPDAGAAPAVALTIAGSEATGGAGAQADLKTFQELGVFGVTPNHFEAESLSGLEITDVESLTAAAIRIHELSGAAVLAKGGVRLAGPDAVDVYYDGETLEVLSAPKVGEVGVSGAGCSLAAAVTAELAKGAPPLEAARTAKAFVTAGIRNRVSSGAPFDALWQGGLR